MNGRALPTAANQATKSECVRACVRACVWLAGLGCSIPMKAHLDHIGRAANRPIADRQVA
jgi:hypothetical protein